MSPVAAIYLIWVLWFAAWLAATVTAPREPAALHGVVAFAIHVTVAVAMLFLLVIFRPWQGIDVQYQLWERGIPDLPGWMLVTGVFASIAMSAWATIHRRKRIQHGAVVIDGGPYSVVRHPVYLGLFAAAAMTAILFGQPTSFLGALLLIGALLVKAVLEERSTNDAAQLAYRRRVPMLVPFWPKTGADSAPRDVTG